MNRIILVRHGATDFTAQGRYQGHAMLGLSSEGHRQAAWLAESIHPLVQNDAPMIFTSDLSRAAQTATYISKLSGGQSTIVDARLRERGCGALSGRDLSEAEELAIQEGISISQLADREFENADQFERRVNDFARDMIRYQHSTRVIVTHGKVFPVLGRALDLSVSLPIPRLCDAFVIERSQVVETYSLPIELNASNWTPPL